VASDPLGNPVPDRTGGRASSGPSGPPPRVDAATPGVDGRRPRPPARIRWTLAAILAIPLIELVVAIMVGRVIGAGWTILALLVLSVLGASVVKRAGLRSLAQTDATLREGRAPGGGAADTIMLFLAGLLLVVPGFVTGVIGLALLLPPIRKVARRPLEQRLRQAAADRVAFFSTFGPGFIGGPGGGFGPGGPGGPGGPAYGPGAAGPGNGNGPNLGGVVITGEVIDDPGTPATRRPKEPGDPT
jgi:UPF0716 protein FxsA